MFSAARAMMTASTGSNALSLIHFDGDNNSTVFTDEKGVSWEVGYATPRLTTSTKQFGTASLYLPMAIPRSTLRSTGSPFNLNSKAPFTAECWFNNYAENYFGCIISALSNGSYAPFKVSVPFDDSGNPPLEIYVGNDALNSYTVNGSTHGSYTDSTWCHLAIVGDGIDLVFYLNGISILSTTQPNWSDANGNIEFGGNDFSGYIDEFRFSSIARYTSDFTPSTSAFELD